MKKFALPSAIAALALISAPAFAASIWQEDFSYPDGTLTNVAYPTWASFSGSGNFIPVSGGEALVGGFGSSADDSRRAIGSSITSGSLYLAALVKVTTAPTSANGEYFLSFYNSPTSGGGYIGRIFASTTTTGWTFGLSNGSSTPVDWGTDLALDTYYKVIAKLDVTAKTTTLGVFSPSYTPVSDSELTLSGGSASTVAAVDYIALRQGTAAQGAQAITGLWLGTDLADVASITVPEPSTMSLLGGLAVLAFVFRRRRI